MRGGGHDLDVAAAEGGPEGGERSGINGGFIIGLVISGYDAGGVLEEIGARGFDAGLFGAGHRMTADEGEAEEGSDLMWKRLHATDIGDEGVGREVRKEAGAKVFHDADRNGEDDEVRRRDCVRKVSGGGEAESLCGFHTFGVSAPEGDIEPGLSSGKGGGTTEKAGTEDRDFLEGAAPRG